MRQSPTKASASAGVLFTDGLGVSVGVRVFVPGADVEVGVGGTCAVTLADRDGGIVFYCPNIGTNNDPLTVTTIFISANAYYDWGWLPFTATNGWTAIVYQ